MKKVMTSVLFVLCTLTGFSQGTRYKYQNIKPKWCVDANMFFGNFSQAPDDAYRLIGSIVGDRSTLPNIGLTVGADVGTGYFIGKKRHFGIGAGIMALSQKGTVTMQNNKNSGVSDINLNTISVSANNLAVPVVLKYKTPISYNFGFTIDAGILLYRNVKSTYSDNSALTGSGVNKNDVLCSFKSSKAGFIIRPAITYMLSDKFSLNIGMYNIYHTFKNEQVNNNTKYKLADNTSSNSFISKDYYSSAGVSIGVRMNFGKPKDSDHDGIPDRKDRCPHSYGFKSMHGCPDTDNDGIVDAEDSCGREAGLHKFHGCPDSDGDGIVDREDSCPHQRGPLSTHGCPDRDGDGIADKNDDCPTVPGLARLKGCPDRDDDGIPDHLDKCPDVAGTVANHGCPDKQYEMAATTAILFGFNKATINDDFHKEIEKVAAALKENNDLSVTISGYTDNIGSDAYNKALAQKRAMAVIAEMKKMGVNTDKVTVIAYGKRRPLETNITEYGRSKNRCVVISIDDNAYSKK